MPILPQEVKRQIDRKFRPDRMGEEGILHLFEQIQQRYYAKQWYGQGADKKRFPDPREGRSPASPYWFKLKYWEAKLIRQAFPELSVEMVAAYDERITKNANNQYEFHYRVGRPVTITKEVAGDPDMMRQRDAILDPAYAEMLDYHARTGHGATATDAERAQFYRVIAEADIQLRPLLGGDNTMYTMNPDAADGEVYISPETIHEAIEADLIRDDGGPLTQMLHYGIMPLHPEFNFIPEGRDLASGKVTGRYVELMIVNPAQFWNQWQQEHPQSDPLQGQYDRYRMFVALDDLFDKLIYHNFKRNNMYRQDPLITTRIFRITEALRIQAEQHSIQLLGHLYRPVASAVEQAFNTSSSREELMARLETLQEQVEDYQP